MPRTKSSTTKRSNVDSFDAKINTIAESYKLVYTEYVKLSADYAKVCTDYATIAKKYVKRKSKLPPKHTFVLIKTYTDKSSSYNYVVFECEPQDCEARIDEFREEFPDLKVLMTQNYRSARRSIWNSCLDYDCMGIKRVGKGKVGADYRFNREKGYSQAELIDEIEMAYDAQFN